MVKGKTSVSVKASKTSNKAPKTIGKKRKITWQNVFAFPNQVVIPVILDMVDSGFLPDPKLLVCKKEQWETVNPPESVLHFAAASEYFPKASASNVFHDCAKVYEDRKKEDNKMTQQQKNDLENLRKYGKKVLLLAAKDARKVIPTHARTSPDEIARTIVLGNHVKAILPHIQSQASKQESKKKKKAEVEEDDE